MLDGFTSAFVRMSGDAFVYSPRLYDTFEAELAASIEAEIEANSRGCGWRWSIGLHVDYHPDWTLSSAAERAGIDPCGSFVFPIKTNMYIDQGIISASVGYGADASIVWASPEGARYWAAKWVRDAGEKFEALAEAPGHDIGELLEWSAGRLLGIAVEVGR
jgi:hypothetical protein